MWRPGPLSGVPPRSREAAGLGDCGPRCPRQGSQRHGLLAGSHGAAALQEATAEDVGAEGLVATLQRDVPLFPPTPVRAALGGHQVQAVRARRQDVT